MSGTGLRRVGAIAPIVSNHRDPRGAWRLGRWPNDPSTAHLVFLDHLRVPAAEDLERALATARRVGFSRVRTSAMFPRAADVVLAAGFDVADTLALLHLALDERHDEHLEAAFGVGRARTTPLRRWQMRAAARVDVAAFGSAWGNDVASLGDIRRATPTHRQRGIWRAGSLIGFAIAGAGAGSGYLQRLAVAPHARRARVGTELVLDALMWMRAADLTAAYVNTGVDNAAALAMYERLGFAELNDRLTIAELALAP